MADARAVLTEAVDEASLLAGSGGTTDEMQTLLLLAVKALAAITTGDGSLPDEDVRNGGLHATGLSHLGL